MGSGTRRVEGKQPLRGQRGEVAGAQARHPLPRCFKTRYEIPPASAGFFVAVVAQIRMRTAGKMCGVRVPPTTGCGACPAATAVPGHCRVDRAWRGSGSAIAKIVSARLQTTWRHPLYRSISCLASRNRRWTAPYWPSFGPVGAPVRPTERERRCRSGAP